MYAETGLMFPYFQDLSQEVQHLDDYCKSQKPNSPSVSILLQASTIAEYDLGGEGDLFKAPEPIIEEPLMGIDPLTAAISMISSGQDVILPQGLKVSDIASLQTEPLFSDVYYECGKDLMEKEARNAALDEVVYYECGKDLMEKEARNAALDEVVLGDKFLPLTIDEKEPLKDEIPVDIPFTGMPTQKSISLECLNSMDWIQGAPMKPSFLDFPVLEFGAAYGMRRAYSEGDIKTLGNGDVSLIHSLHERSMIVGNCTAEERREKLSRYRNKKTKRNFGRKIKYACRKALADSQPRIRGRFAKTEEMEACKMP